MLNEAHLYKLSIFDYYIHKRGGWNG